VAGHAEDPARGVSAHAVLRAGQAEQQRRAARRWPRRSPLVVFASSLLVTAMAAGFVAATGRDRDRSRFENAVQGAGDRIEARLGSYVALLHGATALFAASDTVTAEDFRRYVQRLDLAARYPGVRAIGYSRRLRAASASAAETHAVAFLEPLDSVNRTVVGYDMHADPMRREAMDRARDGGLPAASAALALRGASTAGMRPGFLVYVPVYRRGVAVSDVPARRAALLGFVYAVLPADELFAGIFGQEEAPRVFVRVFDGADTATGTLLVDSRAHAAPGGALPSTRPQAPARALDSLDVGGRAWTLAFAPVPEGSAVGSRDAIALGVAGLGTLVAFTLFFLTRAEVRARERAERSEAERSRFFAAMSHELRTPINAILGYNDLLLAGIFGELPPVQEDGIRRSQRAARHLLELVNDVLDLSKLEAGKVDVAPEPVRVDELLDDLLTTIRPMAEERGCAIELARAGCAFSIRTDPRRVRQILLNLLSNATKFGAGRPVHVACVCVPHGAVIPGGGRRRTAGDAVVIAVRDHGPGIARGDQERIFEEFVQLPGSTPGGTGLGLPISRRLAEVLGGALTVASEPGDGSTFYVTLPRDGRRTPNDSRRERRSVTIS
jgi:signal transduction histidine kinase